MGGIISKSKRRIIPINLANNNVQSRYKLNNNDMKIIEDSIYISCEAYEKIYKNNIELRNKLAKLEKKKFECCVCYNRDIKFKKKIRCSHDLCVDCFYIIQDKKCPVCRVKIKK
tara:strand:- start:747 stop:1088 length:342 start_codon:yes stop_codon:yes gene_type:complete